MPPRIRYYGQRGPKQAKPVNNDIRHYFDPIPQAHDTSEVWKTKPELPSSQELMGTTESEDAAGPIGNRIDGPWDSKDEYLKTHYELLREDSISPLRTAVNMLRADPWMMDTNDIAVYEKVFITGITAARAGLALHIQFSTRRAGKNIAWTYSNRLTPGAIVALTPREDAFSKKCVPAVVACRMTENIEKDPPEVDIFLVEPEDMEIDPQQEWIMVEHRMGYYEATRHTMTALQKLSKESFPLSEHICEVKKDIGPPEYLKAKPEMNFKHLSQDPKLDVGKYNVLEQWPSEPIGRLDASQWSALKEMFVKRLAIIQGPPGTGKTFTSLVALRMLLANRRPHDPPIIIAAQTNHALDQLLRQVAAFEPKYIRLGGRITDPEIRKHGTYALRQEQGPNFTIEGTLLDPAKKKQDKITAEIKGMLKILSPTNSEKPIGIQTFLRYKILSQVQADSLRKTSGNWQRSGTIAKTDPITAWLVDSLKEFSYRYVGDFGFAEDDIDREYEQLKEIEVEHGSLDEDLSTFMSQFIPFGPGLCSAESSRVSDSLVKKQLEQRDLWNIQRRYRGAVYDYMRQQLLLKLRKEVCRLAKDYEDATRRYKIGRFERDYCILEEARVIGMTTTGLSKYRGLISALKPRIILIEEAAEVIEAPVAVACLPSLEHLILVGDHQQLKGQCANHTLAGEPFYLDMSMFERLIRNQMPYIVLQVQRRMIPEIRSLLTPVYGNLLHDHPSVENHPYVPGMGGIRSFFFSHTTPESSDSLASKVNDFEASMVIKFLIYLVMNGVAPEKITVLTFYNGQKKLLLGKRALNSRISLPHINVLTVDSYQGEENDIIILSLVRSNEHRGIGFLAQDNRVCVALSRAKYGLYIFGNSRCVQGGSEFMDKVVKMMSEDIPYRRVGDLKDWDNITDGCEKPCGGTLVCGHKCLRQCHGDAHDWRSCKKRCTAKRPCCGATCICACSPPHEHDCNCPNGKEQKVQVYGQKAIENINPAAAATKAITGPVATRAITTTPTAKKPLTGPDAERIKEERAKGLQRWKDFASGGALVDDYRRAGWVLRDGHFERTTISATPPMERKGVKIVTPAKVETLIDLGEEDHPQKPIEQKNQRLITAPAIPKVIGGIQQNLIDFDDGGLQVEGLTKPLQVTAAVDTVSPAKDKQVSSASVGGKEKVSVAKENLSPKAKETKEKQVSSVGEKEKPSVTEKNLSPAAKEKHVSFASVSDKEKPSVSKKNLGPKAREIDNVPFSSFPADIQAAVLNNTGNRRLPSPAARTGVVPNMGTLIDLD
ncbi:uncharacterized protein N7515_000901 [Penicillium bovifimosum]|uniref:Uncharacterized protein n=1 Tax=Penicillium bovifimosum TaxID=126998 RepID=A0A9W9LBH9_9EURO|nr:uncharacterized protein N7515_000901 [Penicillium bovifimosum]KAJ5146337.1 hypothetical protein N7515_000901 [Penicillium bovifimosum]